MESNGPAGESPEPEVASPPQAGPEPEGTPPGDAPAIGGWGSPSAGSEPPSPPSRRPKAVVIGAIGVVAALAVAIAVKVLPFLAAGVLGSALAGAFGGPWDRLPADVQRSYEQRFAAAIGDRLDGLSDAEKATRIESLVRSGMPRLSDDRLVRRLGLQSTALRSTSETDCAAFGRQSIGGQTVDNETATALFAALATDDLVEWFGIALEAVEAETRGAPEPVFASEAESAAMIQTLLASMAEADVQTISDVSQAVNVADAEVCTAIRALYDAASNLDPASQMIMARVDIQP